MEKESSQSDVDVETSEGMSREERLQMYMDAIMNKDLFDTDSDEDENGRHSMTFREFASLQLDRIETDGFDIEDNSKVYCPGMMVSFYDPPNIYLDHDDPDFVQLHVLASLAIKSYNGNEGTDYGNVLVLKANVEPVAGFMYYITFQASADGNNEIFQAKVYVGIPTTNITVKFVRIQIPRKPILITRPRGAVHRDRQCLNPVSAPAI